MPIKAMVIEDSRIAREGLVDMLSQFPVIDVIGQASNPDQAIDTIREHLPEVLFLDIHMPGKNGFDLLSMINYSPRIIFTTAYSEYAIRSFDYHTIDYLLKPISEERLAAAIDKLQAGITNPPDPGKSLLDISSKILIKTDDRCHLVPLENIRYFESCKNHVIVYFDSQEAIIRKTLNAIEERLPTRHFFRANRQYIINLDRVIDIQESIANGYEVKLSDGKEIELSRRNAALLKNLLSF